MTKIKKIFFNSEKYIPDILSYFFMIASLLINRFWMIGDLSHSLFRGVPNFYSWIALWNCHVLETFGFNHYWTANTMIPYKSPIAFSENMIGLTPIAYPVRILTDNPVLFVNILSLLLVFLTMIIFFNVLKKWTGHRIASLIGTLIFALYPWSMKEFSLGRFHMLAVFLIPLIFLFNVKFWQTGNRKNLLFIFIFFLWTFLSNMYIGIFFTLFIGLFNLTWFFYEKNLFPVKKILLWGISIFSVWLILVPMFFKYKSAGSNIGMIRTLRDQVNYTGPLNSWITVPDENLIYGKVLNLFPRGSKDGIVENYMFPGIVATIFFIFSFFFSKFPKWLKSLRLTTLFMIIISVGPFLPGIQMKIPLPFSLFWYIFPPLQATRNPHRFAIFAVFGIAIMAAYMIKEFAEKKRRNTLFAIILLFVITAEVQTFDKSSVAIEKYSKQFYKRLNSKTNNHIVVELPFEIHTDLRAMASSTFFWHKTVNGVSGLRPPVQTQLERELKVFPSEHTILLLQSLGVDRIVVNERYYGKKRRFFFKTMETFPEMKFLFRIGSKSAWSLKRGRKYRNLDIESDFTLNYESDVEKQEYTLLLSIQNLKDNIIFNYRAPSKFKFTLSRNWRITVFSLINGKKRMLKKLEWNPPALFHEGNAIKKIPIGFTRDPEKIILQIDLPGSSVTLKPFFEISDLEKIR